jgi:hypothetical protein
MSGAPRNSAGGPPARRGLAIAGRGELRFLACGSVDDGKSTLIGRLINDAKGLYRKADAGKVSNVTGRDQPYESPEAPALVLATVELDAETAADRLFAKVLASL